MRVQIGSLDGSYVGPSESTCYIIWKSTGTDKGVTVTVTDVYSKYVYGWET